MGLAVRGSLVIFHCVKVNDVPSLEIIGIPSPFPTGEPDRPKHLSLLFNQLRDRMCIDRGARERQWDLQLFTLAFVHTYLYWANSEMLLIIYEQATKSPVYRWSF